MNIIVVVRAIAHVGGELLHSLQLLFPRVLPSKTNLAEGRCLNVARLVQHERDARLSFVLRRRDRIDILI